MPAPKHSKAAISNAIAAAQAAGLTPTAIRFCADGSLTIDISRPAANLAVCDDVAASTEAPKRGMRHDFPGLLKDKTAAGTLRWRFRVEGKPNLKILLPVRPGEPGFHEHHHAARAGEKVQVKKPQKAKAGTLDALCDGYLSWLEERIEDPDIEPKDKPSPLTLKGHRSLLNKACKVKDPEGDRKGSLDADLPEEAFVHI